VRVCIERSTLGNTRGLRRIVTIKSDPMLEVRKFFMNTATLFPPIPSPNLIEVRLRTLFKYAKDIVNAFNKEFAHYSEKEQTERNLQESLMVGYLNKFYGTLGLFDKFTLEGEENRSIINWLLACREFWRKPAHLQSMIVHIAKLEAELANYKAYCNWQREHLHSPKFRIDTTIQVNDLLHAMEQHGV
jgi:hypothetical protein